MINKLVAGTIAIMMISYLQGCATSQPVPADTFYRLVAEPNNNSEYKSTPINGTLSVSRFTTDALHSERPILYSDDASGVVLNQYRYHHWIDSPANMIQEQLVRYLKDSMSNHVYTTGTTRNYDFLLEGKIFRFERVVGSQSRVDIEIEINLSQKNEQILILTRHYKKEIPVKGDSIHEVVVNFNSGLTEIFGTILKDIDSYCKISQKCNHPQS